METELTREFALNKFTLTQTRRLRFGNQLNNDGPYDNEQYLLWALEELRTVIRFKVDDKTAWREEKKKNRQRVLKVIVQNLDVVEWAIEREAGAGLISRKALSVVSGLTEHGTKRQSLRGRWVLERNLHIIDRREEHRSTLGINENDYVKAILNSDKGRR